MSAFYGDQILHHSFQLFLWSSYYRDLNKLFSNVARWISFDSKSFWKPSSKKLRVCRSEKKGKNLTSHNFEKIYLAKNASYGPKNLAPRILCQFMPGVRLSSLGIVCVCVCVRVCESPFNVVYFIARMHTKEAWYLSLSFFPTPSSPPPLSLWSKILLHWSIRFLLQQ